MEGNSFLKYLKYEVFSFFGKGFPDTVISYRRKFFSEYLKYEVFSFFGKGFPDTVISYRRKFFSEIFKIRSVFLFSEKIFRI